MAALAVFFKEKSDAADNPFLTSLFEAFADRDTADDFAEKKSVDLNLLTSELNLAEIWFYEEGSQTTPPCEEILDAHVIPR